MEICFSPRILGSNPALGTTFQCKDSVVLAPLMLLPVLNVCNV